ncbi:MAG: glyceraldehyde 3-phosphate dehydrogenase NAD-binding domain-containing protein [Acidobacteriota bacterium]
MPTPFALNGLGRIGRAVLRLAADRPEVQPVAINDPAPTASLVARLAHDSVRGPLAHGVRPEGDGLRLGEHWIRHFRQAEPAEIPWHQSGARLVVEASGRFLGEAARSHLGESVERVVLSANSDHADVTLCPGINDHGNLYDPRRHRLVSASSCTTNCLAPVLAVLDAAGGIERAAFTSVHSYTPSQKLFDEPGEGEGDDRRRRAAALNLIPLASTTPAAIGRVLPHLAGRVDGRVVRVPTPAGALLEVTAHLSHNTEAEALRGAFRRAAENSLRGILAVTEDALVSSDFIHRPESAIIDLPLLGLTDGRLARVAAWYDNEWGYAHRLLDLIVRLGGDTEV